MGSLRWVVGRVTRGLLRGLGIHGWQAEEGEGEGAGPTAPVAVHYRMRRLPGHRLALSLPTEGTDGTAVTAEGTAAFTGGDLTVLLGWPEPVVVVRRGGQVLYAEGDFLHFGDLALDAQRVLRRVGYEYLREGSAEVRPLLQLEERSRVDIARALRRLGFDGMAPRVAAGVQLLEQSPVLNTIRLAPGERVRFGPFEVQNDGSFEFDRRPIAGQRGHAYFFRLRRVAEAPVVAGRPPGIPDPLDVRDAAELIRVARAQGLLEAEELLAGEDAAGSALGLAAPDLALRLGEGGPDPPWLRWRGDVLEAHAGRVGRTPDGALELGRAVVSLPPAGPPVVTRTGAVPA